MKKLLTAAVMSAALSSGAFAQAPGAIAFDSATNAPYQPGNVWGDSSNGGFGFGAWEFNTSGDGGRYIGGTGIGDPTFGIFAPNSTSTSSAFRPFSSALNPGDTFSVVIGHTQDIGGEIGLSLWSGGSARITLKFIGGETDWTFNDGGSDFNIAQPYAANTPLTFSFTYVGSGLNENNDPSYTYSYSFGSASGNNFTTLNDISSVDGVGFFNNDQGGGQNFGFNELQIVPEPSTYALLMLGAAAMGGYVIRRRRR